MNFKKLRFLDALSLCLVRHNPNDSVAAGLDRNYKASTVLLNTIQSKYFGTSYLLGFVLEYSVDFLKAKTRKVSEIDIVTVLEKNPELSEGAKNKLQGRLELVKRRANAMASLDTHIQISDLTLLLGKVDWIMQAFAMPARTKTPKDPNGLLFLARFMRRLHDLSFFHVAATHICDYPEFHPQTNIQHTWLTNDGSSTPHPELCVVQYFHYFHTATSQDIHLWGCSTGRQVRMCCRTWIEGLG